MTPRSRLSGMQRQVLGLYRGFLRAARQKAPEERRRVESVVSTEFRQNAKNVDRKNFLYIEYLLRRGQRQLEQLKNPGTTGLSTLNATSATSVQSDIEISGPAYDKSMAMKQIIKFYPTC
ncbi:succinate dehydrogenase assembly factor 1, mitochondrial [Typha latifolia]|uniref:succinate dehydrogenase assembly factor 1, mitochondrial n=1 Tax=Typha latifolia TaxID=4733 RepID=UPI003C2C0387